MSLNLANNSYSEKITLLIKLIECYENKKLSSDEIHYLLETILFFDISKDEIFLWSEILSILENLVNIEFSFYTSDKNDLENTPELFWEEELRTKLVSLKNNLKATLWN